MSQYDERGIALGRLCPEGTVKAGQVVLVFYPHDELTCGFDEDQAIEKACGGRVGDAGDDVEEDV